MLFILQQLAVAFQLDWALYFVSWLIFIRNLLWYSFCLDRSKVKGKKIS